MNKTIINRIIGSIVLGLVAVAVLPKLLTPAPSDFSMQGFEVVVNGNGVNKVDNKPTITIEGMPTLELQSVDEDTAIASTESPTPSAQPTQPATSLDVPDTATTEAPQTLPVKLESLSLADGSQSNRPSQNAEGDSGKKLDKVSWIRVGSYADLENAEKLANAFKARKLPVKIEEVQISGVAYRRVLIGPFTEADKLDKVMKIIQAEGHTPAVQYQ